MAFKSEKCLQFHKVFTWEVAREAWFGEEDICLHAEGEVMGNDRNYGAWCDICSQRHEYWNVFVLTREATGRWLDFTTRMVIDTVDDFEFDITVSVRRDGKVTERMKLGSCFSPYERSRGSEYDKKRGRVYRIFRVKAADNGRVIPDLQGEGSIEIEAEISVVNKFANNLISSRRFVQDMKSITEKTDFTDVDLVCGDQVFKCHKNVLCARVPAFERFLLGSSLEKELNRIEIKDSSAEVVKMMLSYVYTGVVEEIPQEFELELLKIADKYGLDPLKLACGDNLINNLTPSNYLVTYTEIDRYFPSGCDCGCGIEYKDKMKVFFRNNLREVLENRSAWIEFAKKFPELSHEVVLGLA